MQTMANSVFHELTTPESLARIDFQVGALPAAVADPTLMRQVWMNLLSNAIKFSSKRERAVIKVSAQQNQGESVYVVQDNGAGFEMPIRRQALRRVPALPQQAKSSKALAWAGPSPARDSSPRRTCVGRGRDLDKGANFLLCPSTKRSVTMTDTDAVDILPGRGQPAGRGVDHAGR